MSIILETDRLYFRKLIYDDITDLSLILQDKNTMYAYEHAFSNDEVIEWLNRQISRYNEYGTGLWDVILKTNNKLIGQCGITKQLYNNIYVDEIGYLFNRFYWHNGYALESAAACKDYAFSTLGINQAYSIIRENNKASINVAVKNGMVLIDKVIKHYYNMDMPHLVYSCKK